MVVLGPSGRWIAARDVPAPWTFEIVAPPTSTPIPRRLRVVTFNVEHGTRMDALIAVFRSHVELKPVDVLLLQEIECHPSDGCSRAKMLADVLGTGYVYAPSRTTGEDGTHGLAILCRWPLLHAEMMELPRVDLPINRRRCIALAAQVDTPAGPLRLTSVHLDTRINLAMRRRQLAPAIVGAHPFQILAGDMNTLPFHFVAGAVPVLPIDQAGGLDAYMRGLGFATPVTRAGATHRHFLRVRLDAVFTRGFMPAIAHVARDVRVSDHYPVWVDLEWPAGPA